MQQGVPSTLAEISSNIGPSDSYDSADPPGMMDGPLSAPSSPPDTPVPTKCSPISARRASRRMVSGKCALPASITMSPSSRTARQLVDHRIRTRARLDHDQHPTRPLKRGDETGHRLRRDELAIVSMLVDQGLRLGIRPVVDRHPVPMTGEVAGQVSTHHRQPGDADLSQFSHHPSFRLHSRVPTTGPPCAQGKVSGNVLPEVSMYGRLARRAPAATTAARAAHGRA